MRPPAGRLGPSTKWAAVETLHAPGRPHEDLLSMGRFRGGRYRPVDPPRPSPGQARDSTAAGTMKENLPPDSDLVADKACDAKWTRDLIEQRGAVPGRATAMRSEQLLAPRASLVHAGGASASRTSTSTWTRSGTRRTSPACRRRSGAPHRRTGRARRLSACSDPLRRRQPRPACCRLA